MYSSQASGWCGMIGDSGHWNTSTKQVSCSSDGWDCGGEGCAVTCWWWFFSLDSSFFCSFKQKLSQLRLRLIWLLADTVRAYSSDDWGVTGSRERDGWGCLRSEWPCGVCVSAAHVFFEGWFGIHPVNWIPLQFRVRMLDKASSLFISVSRFPLLTNGSIYWIALLWRSVLFCRWLVLWSMNSLCSFSSFMIKTDILQKVRHRANTKLTHAAVSFSLSLLLTVTVVTSEGFECWYFSDT